MLIAQVVQGNEGFMNWLAPGSAVTAVIVVVIIFLRQMRFMQSKHEKAMKDMGDKFGKVADSFQEQIGNLTNTMIANEERRMGQIQQLFDKMMVVSTQSVQAISKLESGFTVLMQRVEMKLDKDKQGT
jgi:ABC-type bacteriocin/lantibiotic exporter with double-glycine peptidase domain